MESKLFIFVLLGALCFREVVAGKKLIVIMIDGFRWDYIKDPTLNLKGIPKIIKNGVRAPYVKPVFPSSFYPNMYSIVTGLYPESHGFINNIMYDKEFGEVFLSEKGSYDEHWWNVAEPIWVTSEKQDKSTAMYRWPGCDVEFYGVERDPVLCFPKPIYGTKPGYGLEKINHFLDRDDMMLLFSDLKYDVVSLALIYYDWVDYRGRYSGAGSSEVQRTVRDFDKELYEMLEMIEKAELKKEVNLMIVSGHGMTNVLPNTTSYIDLERFASNIKFQVAYGPVMMLVPEDGMLDKLYNDLKSANIKGIKIYKKEEIPDSYHLKKSPRMNDIFLKARKGYFIKSLRDPKKVFGGVPKEYPGHDGYHPDDVQDMRTIFFATGPAFRRGVTSKPLSNIDLYNMMCHVIDIQPLPNNGSMELVQDLLSSRSISLYMQSPICIMISLYLTFILTFFSNKSY